MRRCVPTAAPTRAGTGGFANQGIHDYAVYSLAVSSAAPDLVYMLTDGGLSKSADGALTWQYIADSDRAKKLDIRSARENLVQAIAIDPVHADTVRTRVRVRASSSSQIDGGASFDGTALPLRAAGVLPPASAYLGAGALVATLRQRSRQRR